MAHEGTDFVSNPPEDPLGGATNVKRVTEFVPAPDGTMIPLPEGMTPEDLIEQIKIRSEEDPKYKGFIKGLMQQQRGSQIDDPLDPEFVRAFYAKQLDAAVEPGDLEHFAARMDVARSNTLTDKMNKLQTKYFPDTEFRVIQGTEGEDVLMFRHPGDFAFKEVESGELNIGDLAALMGGTINAQTMGEIIASFANKKGAGLVKRALKIGFGASLGSAVDDRIEFERGFGDMAGGPVVERMVSAGVAATAGVFIFDPVARAINYLRRTKGIVAPLQEIKDISDFAARENLPALLPGSVHPIYESMQQQATGTSLLMKDAVQDVFARSVARFEELAKELGDFRDLDDNILRRTVATWERNILAGLDTPLVTEGQMGRGTSKGVDKLIEMLSEREGRAFLKAYDASITQEVRYTLNPAQRIAAAYKSQIVGNLNFKDIGFSVRLGLVPIESPEFRRALNLLIRDDSTILVGKGGASPMERMIRHRGRFFNLKDNVKLTGEERTAAGNIHRSMTAIMKNPRVAARGPVQKNIVDLWRNAASQTLARERFMNKAYARFITAGNTPTEIAEKINLSNPDVVKGIRRIMLGSGQRSRWVSVQHGFENRLLRKPTSIRRQLEGATDPAVRDLLIPPARQEILSKISDDFVALDKSIVKRMLQMSLARGERTIRLLGQGTRTDIQNVLVEAGGRDTPTGRALQAGIIELLMARSTRKGEGGRFVLDRKIFNNWMNKFRQRGILEEVFSPTTLKRIEQFDNYVSILPKNMGVGEGMQKATIGAQISSGALPITPANIFRAIGGIAASTRNRMVALAFTTPKAVKILVGKGARGEPLEGSRLAMIGGFIGTIVEEAVRTAESGSFDVSEGVQLEDFRPGEENLFDFKTLMEMNRTPDII